MSLKEQVPNVYGVGINSVGSYRVSGVPHISSLTIADPAEEVVSFPNVTKNIVINKTSIGGELRVHFATQGSPKPALEFKDVNTNFVLDNFFTTPVNVPSGGTFTIEWWFKFSSPVPTGQISFWNVPHAGPGTFTISSKITTFANGTVIFRSDLKDSTNTGQRIQQNFAAGEIDIAGWNHYVMSVDSGSYKVYINGSDQGHAGMSLTGGTAPVTNMVFPRNSTAPVSLAQITLWDRSLTDSEVSELYNGGQWKSPIDHSATANLTNWYAFDNTAAPADTKDLILDRQGSADITVIDTLNENDTATFVDGPADFLTGSNVVGGHHYVSLTDSSPSISLNLKCAEIFVSARNGTQNVNITANLTNIPASKMFALTGSGIDE